MSDVQRPTPPRERDPSPASASGDPVDPLSEVRDILFRGERERLAALEKSLRERSIDAADVGRVLPEAVAKRARSDDQLASALQPTIEGAIETSIRKNPKTLTDAIFPIIGPAIRRSIQASLSSILESFNHTLENSLSPRSLGWRLEAYRTGRPFSEVVLSHTLLYRVEQAILIDGHSGLLLERALTPSASGDPELVSGMLTAIQDFVSDSFAEGGGVQQVRFGDQRLMVVQGPHAVLAALVRGVPPAAFETRLTETLEEIHRLFGDTLSEFDGDTSVFAVTQPLLESCLDQERRDPAGERRRRFKPGLVIGIVVLLSLTLWLASVVFTGFAERRAWRSAVALLDEEPGIVLISRTEADGCARISVLRDPDARAPAEVVADARLDPDAFTWSMDPYLSLEPEMVAARVARTLAPPATVRAGFDGATLSLSGTASHAWIQQARSRAAAIPGVERVDWSALSDDDDESFAAGLTALAEASLSFAPRSAALDPEAPEVRSLCERLDRLDEAAGRAERTYRIELRGSASAAEWEDGETALGRRRAEALEALLVPRLHHAAGVVTTFAAGAEEELRSAPEVRILATPVVAPSSPRGGSGGA